jgi:hypothetical protein
MPPFSGSSTLVGLFVLEDIDITVCQYIGKYRVWLKT